MLKPINRLAAGLILSAGVVSAAHGQPQPCPGEQERARAIALRVNDEWPLRPAGDEVSSYIQALGERLARAAVGGASIDWRFVTLRDRAPFAFSIGYGFVYVTDGAVRFAGNESDLAAVLAHEIGHQLAGHFCREDADSGNLFSHGQNRSARVGSLSQIIDTDKEREADRRAVEILATAGFDPDAMHWVAEHLPRSPRQSQGENLRLRALEKTRKREGEGRPPMPDSEFFKRAKEIVEAE